jgi:D-ribose pyranose/furanose isomerase RbsD
MVVDCGLPVPKRIFEWDVKICDNRFGMYNV